MKWNSRLLAVQISPKYKYQEKYLEERKGGSEVVVGGFDLSVECGMDSFN
jgi:hypothetical protein